MNLFSDIPDKEFEFRIPQELHTQLLDMITELIGYDRAISYEINPEGKLWARAGKGIDPKDSSYYIGRIPDPNEIMDHALKNNQAQVVIDPAADPRCNPDKVKEHKTKPFAVIPIEHEDEVVGLISLNNWDSDKPLDSKKIGLLRSFINIIFKALLKKHLKDEGETPDAS
jgi:GAF domain-containing protein